MSSFDLISCVHDCSLNMQQRDFGPGPLPCLGGQDSGSDAPKRIGLSFHSFSCARGKIAKLRGHCFHSRKCGSTPLSCSKSQHEGSFFYNVNLGGESCVQVHLGRKSALEQLKRQAVASTIRYDKTLIDYRGMNSSSENWFNKRTQKTSKKICHIYPHLIVSCLAGRSQ